MRRPPCSRRTTAAPLLSATASHHGVRFLYLSQPPIFLLANLTTPQYVYKLRSTFAATCDPFCGDLGFVIAGRFEQPSYNFPCHNGRHNGKPRSLQYVYQICLLSPHHLLIHLWSLGFDAVGGFGEFSHTFLATVGRHNAKTTSLQYLHQICLPSRTIF